MAELRKPIGDRLPQLSHFNFCETPNGSLYYLQLHLLRYFPDQPEAHLALLLKLGPEGGIDGGEEAAGGLGIEADVLLQLLQTGSEAHVWAQMARIAGRAAGYAASLRVSAHMGQERQISEREAHAGQTLAGHFPGVAEQTEAGDIRDSVDALPACHQQLAG